MNWNHHFPGFRPIPRPPHPPSLLAPIRPPMMGRPIPRAYHDPYENMLHGSMARPFLPRHPNREQNLGQFPTPGMPMQPLPYQDPSMYNGDNGGYEDTANGWDQHGYHQYGEFPHSSTTAQQQDNGNNYPQHPRPMNQGPPQQQQKQYQGCDAITTMLRIRKEKQDAVSFFNQPTQLRARNIPPRSQTGPPYGDFGTEPRNGTRLKKLLSTPEGKELWLETKTGHTVGYIPQIDNPLEEDRVYYYNPITLRVSFDRPSAVKAHIVPQSELQKLLDINTPCTLIVKRIHNQLTEEKLRNIFQKFGNVDYVKICRYREVAKNVAKTGRRNLVYFRMEKVQAQKKILEQKFFDIDDRKVEVQIPANRVFIGRIPDGTSTESLTRYFAQEVAKIDLAGYCIDVYFPLPYRQFAFCTVGGQQMAAKLAIKADFLFTGTSITVASCNSESEVVAEHAFEQKMKSLVEFNELARVRSLQNISGEVKFMLQLLSRMKKFENPITLLMQINNEFLKCSEEKLRNYLFVQDHVLDICKLIGLRPEDMSYPLTKKKRKLDTESNENEEGNANFDEDEEDPEECQFDEDLIANAMMSQQRQFVVPSSVKDVVKIITQ